MENRGCEDNQNNFEKEQNSDLGCLAFRLSIKLQIIRTVWIN